MKITWYGHAAFYLLTDRGTRIIIDPYESGAFNGALSYGRIKDEADIVMTSHDHADHSYTKDIQGKYDLIDKAGVCNIRDVQIRTMSSFHDLSEGKERGRNLISAIQADEMVLVHLGDLGHALDTATIKKIGNVDILLVPVGGFFTIDAAAATKVMDDLKPLVTIPMHYKTAKCAFPIAPVADFTRNKGNVRFLRGHDLFLAKDSLPQNPEVVVMEYSL